MKKLTLFFLIFLSFFLKINSTYSVIVSEKNFIKPYCNGNIFFNSSESFTSNKIPKKIDIEIVDSRKWYKNFFKAVKSLGEGKGMAHKRIDRSAKKFSSAKLTAYYKNDIKCTFEAKVRIHGAQGDHISPSSFKSSMRVNLKDGNILNKSQFILFIPRTRNNDNEIFITTLLKELNLLSPLTFSVIVKLNNNDPNIFLFQEKLASTLLKANKRRDGIILGANKRSQINEATNNILKHNTFNLGRIIGSETFENNEIIKALDKMNYLYLQRLGRGDGSQQITEDNPKNYLHAKKDYFKEDYTGFKNFYVFNAIMIATGGTHALSPEDRRFYYDIIYDRIEPIYYDGGIRIMDENFKFTVEAVLEHHKFGAEKAKNYISKLNISKFQKNLKLRGLDLDLEEINYLFQRIMNNLDVILAAKIIDPESPYVKKYYSEHINKNEINFKLAFKGNNNLFQLCDIDLNTCVDEEFSSLESLDIFKEQLTKVKKKNLFYVRKSIKSYINNLPPANNGIGGMKKLDLSSESKIFINDKIVADIDISNKVVKLHMLDDTGRAIVIGKKINDWVFSLQGAPQFGAYDIMKAHGVDPQGCITFIDSEIKGISFHTNDTTCPDTINLIRTTGTIDTIEIKNARYDAFDSDFSNLEIKNIEVENAGQECIGLKGGKYKIINAYLKKCGDKAVSSGEFSETFIENIEITNSRYGLAAKDSSSIIAKNVKIENTDICLIAYRLKKEYQGAYIGTFENNYFCENNNYFIHKGSKWESFN